MPSDDEIIEGEAVEVREERALAVVEPQSQMAVMAGGVSAIARMSDAEFETALESLKVARRRVDQIKLGLMDEGRDYGVIPGTDKPALLKPGMETLLRAFGLADSYIVTRTVGDGETEPDLTFTVRARIHVGSTDGPVIAEGVGEANTWEKKHRYRGRAGRVCPDCGAGTIIKSKPPRTGWWCGKRDGGCGHSFPDGDQRIESQDPGEQLENPDPYDLANTVLKMAKKRAAVDGTLTATGSSGVFTQDEDAPGHQQPPRQNAPGAARTGGADAGAAGTPPAASAPAPAAEEGVYRVKVDERPEGPRQIKGKGLKLEIKGKASGRNHWVTLWGEGAETVDRAGLNAGDELELHADYREEIWQEGKPPKRHLENVTQLRVLRDGEWVLIWREVGAQPALPLMDQPDPAGTPPPAAPAAAPTPPPPAPDPSPAPVAPPPPPPPGPAEEWATMPEGTAINERVTLVEWGVHPDTRPGARHPVYFRAVVRRADRTLMQMTGEWRELLADRYIAEDPAGAVEFRWFEGQDIQLVAVWRAPTGAGKGWAIIVAMG